MKIFENINISDEIEFINSNYQKELGIVNFVNEKKFTVSVLSYSKQNGFKELNLNFFKSGKKTNRFYNYGNATRIVNKWSDFIIKK